MGQASKATQIGKSKNREAQVVMHWLILTAKDVNKL